MPTQALLPALAAPFRGGGRGRAQHPAGEIVDQAGLLRDVDELGRRGDPAVGLAPAQQRFEAERLEGMQRDLRLEHEQQITALDGAPQRLLEAKALRGGVVEPRAVEREAVAAELLGTEQRHVRGAQQPLGIGGMRRIEARADARAGGEQAAVDGQRLLQRGDNAPGAARHFLEGLDSLEQHRELIPAEAREEGAAAGGSVQAPRPRAAAPGRRNCGRAYR